MNAVDRAMQRMITLVALNDEPTLMDQEVVTDQLSVQLIAETFGKTSEWVAKEVITMRQQFEKAKGDSDGSN